MDWRDADSIPRPSGAERDAYIKAEMLALPTNAPFRDVEDLQDVMGMTPEIYAAGEPVSHDARRPGRSISTPRRSRCFARCPGMTDATLNMILQLRSQGRRIDNVADIFGAAAARGRGRDAGAARRSDRAQRSCSRDDDDDESDRADDHGARRTAGAADETDGHRARRQVATRRVHESNQW